MKFATLPPAISTVFLAGLLALAASLSDPRPAWAQTEAACPLPAGGTPVAPPGVTAQEVQGDPGRLREFALASRERSREHARQASTAAQGLYIACLVRQEDGIWRSGSTYIVSLTLDGRVFIHAKDMSLSGGLLDPRIYAGILLALGVPETVLQDLVSPDPATAAGAQQSLIATLLREPDAAFDLTGPVPGLGPGIPGASGYASVYFSPDYGAPVVLLAGFDLTASHLAREEIDYGDPAITARDVVDRDTLKAFVTQAGNYFLELLKSGDAAAGSKARIAMRDPNGPWRHGSVYLYVLDTVANVITFHAAFPDRFEYRPLTPTLRDMVTGEFILPQVLEAAESSPEGGFVEYHFDDPADDTDAADIPKTGYAREFSGQIQRPDGTVQPVDFIVVSGFYGSAGTTPAEPTAAAANRVVETVLPQIMRAMTAGTVDAVSGRMRRLASDAPPEGKVSLGGASAVTDALLANRRSLEDGTFDPVRLLAGSSFVLPLAATGGGGGPLENLTVWGSGDYRSFSGGDRQSVGYEGDVTSGNLGVDTRLGANLLAGISAGQARGAVDYSGGAGTGELTASVTSLNPYVGWQAPGGLNLWAAAGYGWGEVEVDDNSAGTRTSDLTQQMAALGASGPLLASGRLSEGGLTSLKLAAEAAFTWSELDGSGTLAGTKLSVSRQRLMLEGSHAQGLASGASFTPSVEIGLRNDSGDGEAGSGVEAGGGIRYSDPASGLDVEARARTLLAHGEDYEEWGLGGSVRFDPGAAGSGLAISVQPAWGRTASTVNRLWKYPIARGASPARHATGRVNARIAYGIASGGGGMLTPYADLSLSDAGSRRTSLGGRFEFGTLARMSLEAGRSRAAHGTTHHSLTLRGNLNW